MNKLNFPSALLAVLLSCSCIAQEFYLSDHLSYHSAFEEEVFSTEINQFFWQALASSAETKKSDAVDFQGKLNQFYAQIEQAGILGKNRRKSLAKLFNAVHDSFLEVYKRDASITDLHNGTYNCVTASCLYVEVMDHFSIPYAIIESPNHVYLIAYPNEDFIVFETTSPFFDNFQYSKKEIKQLSTQYVKSKLVRSSTVEAEGFLPVYLVINADHQAVERRDLLSFLYGNRFVHEYDVFDKQMNQEQLDKAMLLSDKGLYDEMFTEQVIYYNFENDPRDSVEFLKFIMAVNINKNRNEEAVGIIGDRFTDYRNDYDMASIQSTYQMAMNGLTDQASKDEIHNAYLYNKAIYQAMAGEMAAAIEDAKALYALNPDKEKAKELLQDFLIESALEDANSSTITAQEAMDKLDQLKADYEFITESDDFISAQFRIMLEEAEVAFGHYEKKEGEYWMNRVLEFQKQYGKRLRFDTYRMEIVYAYWADCYYDNGKRRMEIIDQGLELYPRSERLLERKAQNTY